MIHLLNILGINSNNCENANNANANANNNDIATNSDLISINTVSDMDSPVKHTDTELSDTSSDSLYPYSVTSECENSEEEYVEQGFFAHSSDKSKENESEVSVHSDIPLLYSNRLRHRKLNTMQIPKQMPTPMSTGLNKTIVDCCEQNDTKKPNCVQEESIRDKFQDFCHFVSEEFYLTVEFILYLFPCYRCARKYQSRSTNV